MREELLRGRFGARKEKRRSGINLLRRLFCVYGALRYLAKSAMKGNNVLSASPEPLAAVF